MSMSISADRVSVLLAQVFDLADGAGDVHERANEALDLISRELPSSAMALSLWDPFSNQHISVANRSYPSGVLRHLNSWFIDNDSLYARMRTDNTGALRWRDCADYRHSYSAESVFTPAGFDEGMTARLISTGGVCTGAFHVSTDDRRYPRDADVELVNLLRRALSALVDPTVAPRAVAQLLSEHDAAFLVDDHGLTATITEHDDLLDVLSDRALVSHIARGTEADRQFRWQHADQWLHGRVVTLRQRTITGRQAYLVLLRSQELPYGLTARELDVLSLLVTGSGNVELAEALRISPRTVGRHVENIMVKLRVNSRGACSAIARRDGLMHLGPPAAAQRWVI